MRKGIQLLVLLALWIGLTLAILRPAVGQEESPPLVTRVVFIWSALLIPSTLGAAMVTEIMGTLCTELAGPLARFRVASITVAFADRPEPVPALLASCTIEGDPA